MKKKASLEEWQEIGRQAKQARKELFKLLDCVAGGKVPKSISKDIYKAIDDLDKFKSKAEDRMIGTGVSDDLTIFYGEREEEYIESDGIEKLKQEGWQLIHRPKNEVDILLGIKKILESDIAFAKIYGPKPSEYHPDNVNRFHERMKHVPKYYGRKTSR
ncbi:hypothetical protein MZM54_01600 [[Brevibacterium] frigoritolerans]|nr:hypothetical protein [Peribacillus frigoritolerans]